MVRLATRIGGLTLANPVMPASGTFGQTRLIDIIGPAVQMVISRLKTLPRLFAGIFR